MAMPALLIRTMFVVSLSKEVEDEIRTIELAELLIDFRNSISNAIIVCELEGYWKERRFVSHILELFDRFLCVRSLP